MLISAAALFLVACEIPQPAIPSPAATPVPSTAISPPVSSGGEAEAETAIRTLVEGFGKQLQLVSLQAPDASQQVERQYSKFVSANLLQAWMSNVSKAPGRVVSSPWPDRIEITRITPEMPDRYGIDGFVVELTSQEALKGGAAARIPVYLRVEYIQGNWRISEFQVTQ